MPDLEPDLAELRLELDRLRARVRELEESTPRDPWFQVLLSHLPLRVFFKDSDLRYVHVNGSFANDLCLEPPEIVGRGDGELFPQELAEQYRADDRKVLESGLPLQVVVEYRAAGRECHVEMARIPVLDEAGETRGLVGMLSNVEEKKHVAEALRRERHLLKMLMDNVPDCIYFKDTESRFTRVNRAMARRFQLKDPSEFLGKTDFDFFSGEHAAEAYTDEQSVLATGEAIVNKEEKETWHDGRVTWAATTKMPLRDQRGVVIGTFGISRDITVRKEAEHALQRQTKILQSVLDSIADGVVVTDESGQFMLHNAAAEHILDFGPDDRSLGEWLEKCSHYLPDRRTPYPAGQLPLQRALRGEAVDGADVFVRHARATEGKWLSVDARPLREDDGQLVGAVAAFRDVTQRKRAEQALRASEMRYRELFENANDIVYTHDLNGKVTSLNKAGEIAFGFTPEEALQITLDKFVVPEHLGKAREMIQRKLRGQTSTTYELEVVAKDGRRVPLEVSTRIVFEGNQPIGVQGIARDITERRRAEEALQWQARQLSEQAEELERRNEALSKAYAELKEAESQLIQSEKMAAIGQLVAGLAHEVNNPAAFVMTNLTVIARDLEDLLEYQRVCEELEPWLAEHSPQRAETLARVRRERGVAESTEEIQSLLSAAKGGMARIRDLVTNLRGFSRIETRGDFVMGDLNEGLHATLVMLRPIIPKGIEIGVHEHNLPVVECNLAQINQVFMNLLVNAAQAVGSTGKVEVHTERVEDGVLVRVVDNGPGIAEKIRSKIFDPFFTTKEVGKGTGLGLSISRRIIEAHHGRIDVESEAGKGAEFRVWLPLRQPADTDESGRSSDQVGL